jgi:hypothetical protein
LFGESVELLYTATTVWPRLLAGQCGPGVGSKLLESAGIQQLGYGRAGPEGQNADAVRKLILEKFAAVRRDG